MKQYQAEVWDATANRRVVRVYRAPEGNEFRFDENGFAFGPELEGHELTLEWKVVEAVTWVPLPGENPVALAVKGAALERDFAHYLRHYEPQQNLIHDGPDADGGYPVPHGFVEVVKLQEAVYREIQVPMYEDGYPTCFFPPLTRQLLDAETAHEEARWDRLRRRYASKHPQVDTEAQVQYVLDYLALPHTPEHRTLVEKVLGRIDPRMREEQRVHAAPSQVCSILRLPWS